MALVDRMRRAVVAAHRRLKSARRRPDAPGPARQADIHEGLEALAERLALIDERVAGVARRVEEVQQLVARVHERGFDFPGQVAAMRASESYAEAYAPAPLVSVVVPTFNRAEMLCERGLPSVLSQSYERLEVIVVGNACSDDTVERVTAMDDPRVRVVNLPFQEPEPADEVQRWHNSGTVPINHGLHMASGSWIAIQHDDDEWDREYVETMLQEAQRTRAELAYCRARVVHDPTDETMPFQVGMFPPVKTQFGAQFSMFHAGLRFFGFDRACAWIDEPNDWNFARRMWEAGVRFNFVATALGTYHLTPRTDDARRSVAEWLGQRNASD